MTRRKTTSKGKIKAFLDPKQGCKNVASAVGDISLQTAKEVTSFPAFFAREITGQSHKKKPTVGLKKGWFD